MKAFLNRHCLGATAVLALLWSFLGWTTFEGARAVGKEPAALDANKGPEVPTEKQLEVEAAAMKAIVGVAHRTMFTTDPNNIDKKQPGKPIVHRDLEAGEYPAAEVRDQKSEVRTK